MIYLLLKIHKITKLKYLCKHESENEYTCFIYPGSGTFWKRHLRIHGSTIKTFIIKKFDNEDKDGFKEFARNLSIKWRIVERKDFANLKWEEGNGGTLSESSKIQRLETIKNKTMNGKPFIQTIGDKISKSLNKIDETGKTVSSSAAFKREEKKRGQFVDGVPLAIANSRKTAQTMMNTFIDGKSLAQIRGENSSLKLKNTLWSNGLNSAQNGCAKAYIKKYPDNIIGEKQQKQWNLPLNTIGRRYKDAISFFEGLTKTS